MGARFERGRAEDHRGAPDSDGERGHTLADSSRAVVRGREEEMERSRGGRADNGHNTGLTIKTAAGVDLEACFGGGPRSEVGGAGCGRRSEAGGVEELQRENQQQRRSGVFFVFPRGSQTDTSPF